MSIKRGVSSYSYQQALLLHNMDWKGFIREVHDNLHADGIEIIDEQIIRDYPFPSDRFVNEWNEEMAKYNMTAVTMDVYLDVHQFRDHVMTYDEAADRLKRDIRLAAKLGFKNVRCLALVPIEVIEKAVPTADECSVRIGKEIHAPLSIKPGKTASLEKNLSLDPRSVDQIIELAQKTGSKNVGLVPDFGIFQYKPSSLTIEMYKTRTGNPEMIDFILDCRGKYSDEEIGKLLDEKYPGHPFGDPKMLHNLTLTEMCSQPDDLRDIIPYIVSIHGKFYNMIEDPENPGNYIDDSINYRDPVHVLKDCGFDGYIDSEYEGQVMQKADIADEVGQVRRHHKMMQYMIENA